MKIKTGNGTTKYGPGVTIDLDGNEIAIAIEAWLVAHSVHINGSRTITVNGKLCNAGKVYVDPSGFVITPNGEKINGGLLNNPY